MQTHLDHLEALESWRAWADAPPFLIVKAGEQRVVPLSRWDVHNLLESATEAAFCAPGSGGAGTPTHAFLVGQGHRGAASTSLVVQRPTSAAQWIAEIITLAQGSSTRFYQAGPWIVRVSPPDYYAQVHAATTQDRAEEYRLVGETYREMFGASSEEKDRTAAVLDFLAGRPRPGLPAAMAQLITALCVSEAARNHRCWGINLMLLDLLRGNAVPGSWSSLIQNEMHPMAKGSTFDHGQVGMKGGRVSRSTWSHEAAITMLWLMRYGSLPASGGDLPGRRWRDPAKGEAQRRTVQRKLMSDLTVRLKKIGLWWD